LPPVANLSFKETREDLKGQNLSFTEIAKLVGQNWQLLSPEEKSFYEAQAAAAKQEYQRKLSEYKKTDKYKEYLKYLADFRAKHGGASGGMTLSTSATAHLQMDNAPMQANIMLLRRRQAHKTWERCCWRRRRRRQ
jgi:hypothetical protein